MLVEGEWTLPALRAAAAAAGMCAVKFGLYDIPAGGGRAGPGRAGPSRAARARPRARRLAYRGGGGEEAEAGAEEARAGRPHVPAAVRAPTGRPRTFCCRRLGPRRQIWPSLTLPPPQSITHPSGARRRGGRKL